MAVIFLWISLEYRKRYTSRLASKCCDCLKHTILMRNINISSWANRRWRYTPRRQNLDRLDRRGQPRTPWTGLVNGLHRKRCTARRQLRCARSASRTRQVKSRCPIRTLKNLAARIAKKASPTPFHPGVVTPVCERRSAQTAHRKSLISSSSTLNPPIVDCCTC